MGLTTAGLFEGDLCSLLLEAHVYEVLEVCHDGEMVMVSGGDDDGGASSVELRSR